MRKHMSENSFDLPRVCSLGQRSVSEKSGVVIQYFELLALRCGHFQWSGSQQGYATSARTITVFAATSRGMFLQFLLVP